MKKLILLALLIPLPALAMFAAVGKKLGYLDEGAKPPFTAAGTVAVAVLDQRPYVLDGSKEPDLVGTLRGGFGNPFAIRNKTGHALADDIATSIATALKSAGMDSRVITTRKGETVEAVQDEFKASNTARLVLLQLQEFKTDGYASQSLHTDVTFSVYVADGGLLASFPIKNDRILGKLPWKFEKFEEMAATAYRAELDAWFATPGFGAALSDAVPAPPPGQGSPEQQGSPPQPGIGRD